MAFTNICVNICFIYIFNKNTTKNRLQMMNARWKDEKSLHFLFVFLQKGEHYFRSCKNVEKTRFPLFDRKNRYNFEENFLQNNVASTLIGRRHEWLNRHLFNNDIGPPPPSIIHSNDNTVYIGYNLENHFTNGMNTKIMLIVSYEVIHHLVY